MGLEAYRTTLTAIVTKVIEILVNLEVMVEEGILVVANDRKAPYFFGEQDLLLCVRGLKVDVEASYAGGRRTTEAEGRINLTPRTRLYLDETGRDRQRLMHSSLGHNAFEMTVLEAMQLFHPGSDTPYPLTMYPMHWLGTSDAEDDPKDPNWVRSTLSFEFKFIVTLDQTRQ